MHVSRSVRETGHIKVSVEIGHFEIQASKMPAVHCAEAKNDEDGDELSHRGVAIRMGLVECMPSEAAATFRLVVNTVDKFRGPHDRSVVQLFALGCSLADRGSAMMHFRLRPLSSVRVTSL